MQSRYLVRSIDNGGGVKSCTKVYGVTKMESKVNGIEEEMIVNIVVKHYNYYKPFSRHGPGENVCNPLERRHGYFKKCSEANIDVQTEIQSLGRTEGVLRHPARTEAAESTALSPDLRTMCLDP